MKKILTLLITLLSIGGLYAQGYDTKVHAHSGKVGKMNHAGLAINIDLDKKEVKDAWKKELKQMGKVDSESGVYLIESAHFSDVASQPVRILSTVEETGKGTRVWLSINNGNGYIKNGTPGYGPAKDFLKNFAKRLYKQDIELQISDAEKALEETKKTQTKVIEAGVILEKSLLENEEEKVELQTTLEQNKNNQELAIKNVAAMEEALEVTKQKIEKVR